MNYIFPKNIHFIWFQGFNDISYPVETQYSIDTWANKNPNWEIFKWDEEAISKFIKDKYPNHYGCWKNLDKVIKKCDYARWLIIHYYGGVYADCDMFPLKSMDEFLSQKTLYYSELDSKICSPAGNNTIYYPKESDSQELDFTSRSLILGKEWFSLKNSRKNVIGNGLIIGTPNNNIYLDFIKTSVYFKDDTVLESFGTWRLTKYIDSLTKKERNEILVLPPPYTSWFDFCEWTCSKDVLAFHHKYFSNWAKKNGRNGWLI